MNLINPPAFGLAPAWATTMVQASAKAMTIAVTAPQVIGLRLSMLVMDGNTAKNRHEVERMVTEKVEAVQRSSRTLFDLAGTMTRAWPTMFFDVKAAERMLNRAAKSSDKALTPFSRRVSANHKRLTR